jgi:hypothetical protein
MNMNNQVKKSTIMETPSTKATTGTLGCFSCVACPLPLPWSNYSHHYDEEMKQRMEDERQEGQALLRSMVTTDDKVDWQAIIQKAEQLHSRERALLQQQSGQERRLFVQRQKRALQKRRKFDSIGSFSINLLTYRMDAMADEKADASNHVQKTTSVLSEGSTRDDENSAESRSPPSSPIMVCSSFDHDEPVTQIDEDTHTPPMSPPTLLSRSTSSNMLIFEDHLEQDGDFGSV